MALNKSSRHRTGLQTERTPLLSQPAHNAASDSRSDDDEDCIDEDEFQHVVANTTTSGGIGMEPAPLQHAMLRGSRRFSSGRADRSGSFGVIPRPAIKTPSAVDEEAIDEDDSQEAVKASPYLGGITVRRFWLIYGGLLANMFIAIFDSTIMASSHPVITSYFQASNSAAWLSTSFMLTSTTFQPLVGRLSDTIGRKGPCVFSLVVFLLGTLWCALASSIIEFILARAVCGLGAGGMMSMGSIITSDLVPIETRGVYQSYINIMYGLGAALGAATGGFLADNLGWRWEFALQVPFIALCTLSAILFVPADLGISGKKEGFRTAMKSFDYIGSSLMSMSVTFLILGLNIGGNLRPWSDPWIIVSLTLGVVLFPAFIFAESKAFRPIMPLNVLSSLPRANIIYTNALGAIIVNSVLFNVPLYTQAVLLKSATESGLRLVIPTVAATIAGVATGFLITWSKRLKWPLVTGPAMMLTGTICLSFTQQNLPDAVHLAFLVPAAMGQGFMFPGCFIALLAVSEQQEQAVVTSTMILWRSLGNVLGVALSSLVVQNSLVIYLDRYVTGPEKAAIIGTARTRVSEIITLPLQARAQVVSAYAASLRVTFIATALLSFLALLIIVPIRMPRLGTRK